MKQPNFNYGVDNDSIAADELSKAQNYDEEDEYSVQTDRPMWGWSWPPRKPKSSVEGGGSENVESGRKQYNDKSSHSRE